MAKTSCKKGQYYCNTDKKCKPIPRGFTVREDGFLVREGWSAKYKKSIDCNNPKGFSQKAHCAGKKKKMTEESNPRIARKKGQPAKSKKHSDLYTDEDPKGTIHGLGFKDVATAKASVAKIRKSSRSHAHKIQAAIAMEQRARVMGKTSEAAVYRKFINSMKKKTKAMNEEKHGDHEYEMIRRQTDNIMVAAKKLKKKVGKGEGNAKAWVQSKITKASDYLDTAADYMTDKDNVKEGTLRSWFKGSKSKDGKGGWVNVKTGGTCASDEPGEGVPKCVSRSKYDSMSKKERESAHRRKRAADPNQQSKTGAAKPTYVSTDKPKKKKKMKEEFISLPLQLEVPQNDGEFRLGLMFRESLEKDRGMLFVFETTDYHCFHMKNTFIPLDIAFINEEGVIESIKELDPMSSVPVYPDGDIRYAVEVNRGWFAENGVEVGDIILEDTEETEIDLTEVKDKKGKGSGTKDACYYKVKSRYSVWPSAYASGALVKCRKVGAANWGNKSESVEYKVEPLIGGVQKKEIVRNKGVVKRKKKPTLERLEKKAVRKEHYEINEKEEGFNTTGVKGITKKGDKVFKDGRQLSPYGIKQLNVKDGAFSEKGKERRALKDLKNRINENHYNWRDSFDLDEQALNMAQRRAARGSRYKAPAPKPQPKPAPQAAPDTQAKPAAPMAQVKPAAPAPKMGRTEVANRQKLGNERVDALKAKNAQFQAAKKSGNLKQFRADNPKMSGRERAQAMARARIASKRAEQSSPTAPKPTVDKVPPTAQAKSAPPAPQAKPTANTVSKPAPQAKPTANTVSKPTGGAEPVNVPKPGVPTRKVTSSTTQSGNTTTTQTNVKSGVTGGTTKDLTSSAGSLQKNQQKAKQLANTANKNAAMSGSGATTSVGKINFGGF